MFFFFNFSVYPFQRHVLFLFLWHLVCPSVSQALPLVQNRLKLTQNIANYFLDLVENANAATHGGKHATTHHYSSAYLFSDKTYGSNKEILQPACVSSWPCNNPAAKCDELPPAAA